MIRAARKAAAHEALAGTLTPLIETAPGDLRAPLAGRLAAAVAFTERVAREGAPAEHLARQAATGLYNATTAVLLAAHATALGEPWRAEAARLVLLHRLGTTDPLAPEVDDTRPVDALLAALAG